VSFVDEYYHLIYLRLVEGARETVLPLHWIFLRVHWDGWTEAIDPHANLAY